jgi:hypothetical protein
MELRALAMAIDYVHELPGRVRIRCRSLRKQTDRIAVAKDRLESTAGVRSVAVNPVTGSFTILYDPARTSSAAFLDAWETSGEPCSLSRTPESPRDWPLRLSTAAERGHALSPQTTLIAKMAARFVIEKALERSLLAIAAAVL